MVLKSKLKTIKKEFGQLCKLLNKKQEENRKFLVEGLESMGLCWHARAFYDKVVSEGFFKS